MECRASLPGITFPPPRKSRMRIGSFRPSLCYGVICPIGDVATYSPEPNKTPTWQEVSLWFLIQVSVGSVSAFVFSSVLKYHRKYFLKESFKQSAREGAWNSVQGAGKVGLL